VRFRCPVSIRGPDGLWSVVADSAGFIAERTNWAVLNLSGNRRCLVYRTEISTELRDGSPARGKRFGKSPVTCTGLPFSASAVSSASQEESRARGEKREYGWFWHDTNVRSEETVMLI
jgi:hypothetical protein